MRLHERKLLIVCNDPGRFGGHMYCDGGDIMSLTYHVTSHDHVFKGLCDFMGEEAFTLYWQPTKVFG